MVRFEKRKKLNFDANFFYSDFFKLNKSLIEVEINSHLLFYYIIILKKKNKVITRSVFRHKKSFVNYNLNSKKKTTFPVFWGFHNLNEILIFSISINISIKKTKFSRSTFCSFLNILQPKRSSLYNL